SVHDVVIGRVDGPEPPAWCTARGWAPFLLGLDDDELARCETEGLAARMGALRAAPDDLVGVTRDVADAVRLPRLAEPASAAARAGASASKRVHIAALVGAVRPMAAHARRIVDVGAGRGHFTRIAAAAFACEALGLERDAGQVATASAFAGEASFSVFD